MAKVKLVAGDTAPDMDVVLVDASTGGALDVSNVSDVVRFYMTKVGQTTPVTTVVCTKPNGGADGKVRVSWATGLTEGEFEGEFEITFASGKIQTVYEKLRLSVRGQIA